MKPTPSLRIWTGQTVHERFQPFSHRFKYGLFLIDIDIDRLDEAGRMSSLFRAGAPGMFSFRTEDHGAHIQGPLRPWAETMLDSAGVAADGPIRLVTFPRHLGYKFAPISLWFAHDRLGVLKGIIYEVNNTFGEHHSYVARVNGLRSVHESSKNFHVSPFFDVTGKYRFTLRKSDDKIGLVIENLENTERLHLATISANVKPATTAAFARAALLRPLSTLGVAAAIHWQALKLWTKGARYRRKPTPPTSGPSLAIPALEAHPPVTKDAA